MKKPVVIIIIIIAICGVLGLSFYAGTRLANYEDSEKVSNKEKEKESKVEVKELSLDDEIVEDANNIIPAVLCSGYNLELNGKSRTVDELTSKEKLSMVVSYYTNKLWEEYDGEDEPSATYTEEDFKKLFEDTSFLKDLKKAKDFSMSMDARKISYKNGKYLVETYATGCVADEGEDDFLSLYKATKSGDTLTVTYAYYYYVTKFNEEADEFDYMVYKAKGDKDSEVKNPEFDDQSLQYKLDWDKYDKYSFVFDIKDGNLRLQKINFEKA